MVLQKILTTQQELRGEVVEEVQAAVCWRASQIGGPFRVRRNTGWESIPARLGKVTWWKVGWGLKAKLYWEKG